VTIEGIFEIMDILGGHMFEMYLGLGSFSPQTLVLMTVEAMAGRIVYLMLILCWRLPL
jgi:hypothetical protein